MSACFSAAGPATRSSVGASASPGAPYCLNVKMTGTRGSSRPTWFSQPRGAAKMALRPTHRQQHPRLPHLLSMEKGHITREIQRSHLTSGQDLHCTPGSPISSSPARSKIQMDSLADNYELSQLSPSILTLQGSQAGSISFFPTMGQPVIIDITLK